MIPRPLPWGCLLRQMTRTSYQVAQPGQRYDLRQGEEKAATMHVMMSTWAARTGLVPEERERSVCEKHVVNVIIRTIVKICPIHKFFQ